MATQHVLTAAAAGLFLVGLVLLAPPGLLRPARHAFTPRNTHYSWVIKGAPLPGETADAASFGGGGFQYMHMAMMERLPNGTLAVAFQASPTSYEGSAHQAGLYKPNPVETHSLKAPGFISTLEHEM
jgi:hypothetical protein